MSMPVRCGKASEERRKMGLVSCHVVPRGGYISRTLGIVKTRLRTCFLATPHVEYLMLANFARALTSNNVTLESNESNNTKRILE